MRPALTRAMMGRAPHENGGRRGTRRVRGPRDDGPAMATNLRSGRPPGHRLEPDARPRRRLVDGSARPRPPRRPTVARASDVVMVCVSDTPDVEAVLFGEDGVADGLRRGRPRHRLLDDLAAASPRLRCAPRGAGRRLSSTPRSPAAARAPRRRRSRSSAAATAADVERARPILGRLGKTITHVGPTGRGQAVKAVNQVIIAGSTSAVAEGIVLAMKAGLDVGARSSRRWVAGPPAAGSSQNRSGRMIANDYPLGFKASLHLKDLGSRSGWAARWA